MFWCKKLTAGFVVVLLTSACSFQGLHPTDTVQNDLQWDGKIYSQNAAIQYNWVQDMLDSLDLKGSESILDVGTGNGKVAAELSQKVPQGSVTGIDSSASMIDAAKIKYPATLYPNLRYHQNSAETLSYKNTFDYVTSFWTLHWIENKQAVFDGMFSSLKPGGKALLYFGPDEGEKRLDQAIADIASELRWPKEVQSLKSGFYLPTAADIHQMLRTSGFNINYYKVVYKTEQLPSKKAFIKWMGAWLPHLEYLSDKEKAAFTQAVADKYLSWRIQGKNGEVYYDDYMLEAIVTKPQ